MFHFERAFEPCMESICYRKMFWDKNLVKWGMDLVRKLKNGKSKSKSEKKFEKLKKNG